MTSKRVHLALGIFWILMAIPTLLFWHNSITLVLLMSLYANVEASFSAWESTRTSNCNCGENGNGTETQAHSPQ